MTLLRRWALAALLLAAPAAAPGQPSASATQDIPAEVLAPSAEVEAMFEALRERPATGDTLAGLTPEQAAPMDAIIGPLFTRGETVADWQDQGVNLRALIAARPGGAAAQMFEGTAPFGPYRIYPGDAPVASLIPAQWVLVGSIGERGEGGAIQVEIARISPKVIMIERIGLEELGNATCRLHGHALFYADPAVPASEMDLMALMMGLRTLPEIHRQALCAVSEERAPGAYGTRYFDRSGRRLPQLDTQSVTLTITPRAPFPANAGPR